MELARKTEEHFKGMMAPGTLFEELGFNYIGPIDGHDLPTLVTTLENMSELSGPQFLHIITKKGKGFAPAEADQIKYHALSPVTAKASTGKKLPTFSNVFGQWACDTAHTDNRLMAITPAMREGSDLIKFSERFPERYFDVAIAEQHAVTLAAGMACEGVKPVVAIYSTFLQRAYDHIIHDAAIQHLPVVFCMDRAGIAGEDGPTHHGALDIAYLKCIQDLIVTAPKDGNELRHLLYTALDYSNGPFSIRYPKASSVNFDLKGQAELLPIGSWEVCRKSNGGTVILAVGPQVFDAINAANNLSKNGIECEVVNCRFIKPMDTDYLNSITGKFENVITIEEGVKTGGFGESVASWLITNGYKGNVDIISLPDEFVEHGPRDLLLEKWGVSQNGIVKAVTNKVNPSKIQL